jgi:hypothetical protein
LKLLEVYDILYKMQVIAPSLIFSYISPIRRKVLTIDSKSKTIHEIIMQLFGNRYDIEIRPFDKEYYNSIYILSIKNKSFIFHFELTIYNNEHLPYISFLDGCLNKDKKYEIS